MEGPAIEIYQEITGLIKLCQETNNLEQIEALEVIKEKLGQLCLVPIGTPIICYKCKRVNAPLYFLRRSGGKYVPICHDTTGGCWRNAVPPSCDWVDYQGVACDNKAEWEIKYGVDELTSVKVCIYHVGVYLTDVDKHNIYRLD